MKSISCYLLLSLIFLPNSAIGNPFSCKIDQDKHHKKSLLLDRISYKGYVLYGSKNYAIVKLDTEEHILGPSEQLQNYRVVTVTPRYIEFKNEDHVFRIAINAKDDFK